jgi:alpha-L-arabinofuranosidase
MRQAEAVLHADEPVCDIDPRLYGSFAEHLGRCIYGGLYEPDSPEADEHGFRRDVADLVRELMVPIVRYPGGNFISSYRWEDTVGPPSERPTRLEYAWRVLEDNQFGLNEFVTWCRAVDAEPMLAVNLGTRGAEDAVRLAEYANHPGGTELSDLRIRHGFREPHRIRTMCLGNEMDGPWQAGHKTASEYGRVAAQAAGLLKQFDPELCLVLCGSSGKGMPTFPEWDRTVLETAHDLVDLISLHAYYSSKDGTPSDFLASPLSMDEQIRAVIATCDYARAKTRGKKRVDLCFDEYNVWDFGVNPEGFTPWQKAPAQVEQIYTMRDAVVVGGLLVTLLRHAERVRVACMAQIVNVIAPIMAYPGKKAVRQTIFYPLLHASRFGRGSLLPLSVRSPAYDSKHGSAPYVDAVATRDGDGVTIFCVHRGENERAALDVRVVSDRPLEVTQHLVLEHADPLATNTADAPGNVVPNAGGDARADGDHVTMTLAPLSWNVVRLTAA